MVPGWPQTKLRIERRKHNHFSVRTDAWSVQLRKEVADLHSAWISGISESGSALRSKWSVSTAAGARMRLYRLLNAYAVVCESRPENVTSVAQILDPVVFDQVMDFINDWSASNGRGYPIGELSAAANLVEKLAAEQFRHVVPAVSIEHFCHAAKELRRQKANRWPRKASSGKVPGAFKNVDP